MPEGGLLHMSGQLTHGDSSSFVEMVVSDSGPGVAPRDLERIFEAGYTTSQGSPGLGLTVCRTIAEQHGAPYAPSITAAAEPALYCDFPWRAGMKQVLIVDDDAGMRAALDVGFRRRGWRVDTAVGTRDALAKFKGGQHSLVITDIRMPDGDGFAVMRGVRTLAPDCGHPAHRLRECSRRSGGDEKWSLRLPGEADPIRATGAGCRAYPRECAADP